MMANDTNIDSPKWLLTLKATIRPFLTYIFTILYVYVFLKKDEIEAVYISGLNSIMLLIIAFWFGERLLRNTGITEFLLQYNKNTTSVKEDKKN
jgi:hypothetical protein